MTRYLADISDITQYDVRLDFTPQFEPSTISEGLPLVSVADEIHANAGTPHGEELREKYGKTPYGAPLYLWEVVSPRENGILYIGQTMLMPLQKRFEGHSAAIKILADHVNIPDIKIYYRLCSRLDIHCTKGIYAIEHFPLEQARLIVDDIEAFLIFRIKPRYNTTYKSNKKKYNIPFRITERKNIVIP